MESLPTPQLLEFLHQAIACCRANAVCAHVPPFARVQLTEARRNIEFFVEHREFQRATQEAARATQINSSVVKFIQAFAEATATLQEELGDL
jgi:hypothetical protein